MGLDLSGVTASNGKPKGNFTLRVCEVKEKTSKNNEQYLNIKLAITGENFNKFSVYDSFMLEGKGAPIGLSKLAHLIDCLGLDRQLEYDEMLNRLVGCKLGQDKEGYTKVSEYKKHEKPESEV